MKHKPAIKSLQEINEQFTKLSKSDYNQTTLRLKECMLTDGYTPVDGLKCALNSFNLVLLVSFEKPVAINKDTETEYRQKALIFEDKLHEMKLSYLNLDVLDKYIICNPRIGYLIWGSQSELKEDELLKLAIDWKSIYENISVTIFKHKKD